MNIIITLQMKLLLFTLFLTSYLHVRKFVEIELSL